MELNKLTDQEEKEIEELLKFAPGRYVKIKRGCARDYFKGGNKLYKIYPYDTIKPFTKGSYLVLEADTEIAKSEKFDNMFRHVDMNHVEPLNIKIDVPWGRESFGLTENKETVFVGCYTVSLKVIEINGDYIIAKVPCHKSLCGAKGHGMYFSERTEYLLIKILKMNQNSKFGILCNGDCEILQNVKINKKWKDAILYLRTKIEEYKKEANDQTKH